MEPIKEKVKGVWKFDGICILSTWWGRPLSTLLDLHETSESGNLQLLSQQKKKFAVCENTTRNSLCKIACELLI